MQATENQPPDDTRAPNSAPTSTFDSAASFEYSQSSILNRNKSTEGKSIFPDEAPLYNQLDEKTLDIRILNLLPGSDEIVCTLDCFSYSGEFPEYTTLSYCWGNGDETESIFINGRIVNITRSLFEAMQELRRREFSRLWIDAICINQNDVTEKSHQVRRMGDIYRNATQTIAWLGRENLYPDEIHTVLALLASDQFDDNAKEEMMEIRSADPFPPTNSSESTNLKAIDAFLDIPYWKRTWIVQELTLAKKVQFFWGEQSLDYHMIDSATTSIQKISSLSRKLPNHRILKGIFRIMENSVFRPLYNVLSNTASSQATEPHDKIFAVLGLAKNGFEVVPEVDYSKPLDDIFREAMIRIFTTSKEKKPGVPLDLICFDNPRKPRRLDLPSWVIDWSAIWRSRSSGSNCTSTTRRSLNKYRACGDQPAKVRFVDSGRTMVTSGYIIDTIQSISCAFEDVEIETSTPQNSLPPENSNFTGSGAYGNESLLYNAIWRSFVYDRNATSLQGQGDSQSEIDAPAPAIFEYHFQQCFNPDSLTFLALGINTKIHLQELIGPFNVFGRSIEEWSKHTLEAQGNIDKSTNFKTLPWIKSLVFRNFYRRFMVTWKGYVGVTHAQSQVGDSIVLLRGCTIPMILRRCDGGWRVVGEAYVHGIMGGEAWKGREGEEMETIHLK